MHMQIYLKRRLSACTCLYGKAAIYASVETSEGVQRLTAHVCLIISYQILDVLYPVNREGSYQGEKKCIPTTSELLIHYSIHIPPLRIEDIF